MLFSLIWSFPRYFLYIPTKKAAPEALEAHFSEIRLSVVLEALNYTVLIGQRDFKGDISTFFQVINIFLGITVQFTGTITTC